jgi:integrase
MRYQIDQKREKTVHPIKTIEDIKFIEQRVVADKPRDHAIFVFGINSNLRASDLVRIKVGEVRYLNPGDNFQLSEQKTGKKRFVTVNNKMHAAIQPLLKDLSDDQYLFASAKFGGTQPLTVAYLNRLVKGWCRQAKLRGNFGSHTLRKTWAHTQYRHFGADIADIMEALNHSSQKETLRYIGIEQVRVKDLFMREV